MTGPDPGADLFRAASPLGAVSGVADQIGLGVQQLTQVTHRLGMVWRLRPLTVTGTGVRANVDAVTGVWDGDTALSRFASMIGPVPAGARCWGLFVPPSGSYIIGWQGQATSLPLQQWTPQLLATTTAPTLGTGSTRTGQYRRVMPDLIHAWGQIRFGTSGTAAGTGNYRVTLPTASTGLPTSSTVSVGALVGTAVLRDNSALATGSRTAAVQLVTGSGGPQGQATAMLPILDGTNTQAAAAGPFAWAASDGIGYQVCYPAAAGAVPIVPE